MKRNYESAPNEFNSDSCCSERKYIYFFYKGEYAVEFNNFLIYKQCLSKTDHFQAYFQLPIDSKEYEPHLLKKRYFLDTYSFLMK